MVIYNMKHMFKYMYNSEWRSRNKQSSYLEEYPWWYRGDLWVLSKRFSINHSDFLHPLPPFPRHSEWIHQQATSVSWPNFRNFLNLQDFPGTGPLMASGAKGLFLQHLQAILIENYWMSNSIQFIYLLLQHLLLV